MAIERHSSGSDVSLWTRNEKSTAALREALPHCRVTTNLPDAVGQAEIVVLCTPPEAISGSGPLLAECLPAGACVTDAGSIKAQIVAALEPHLGGRFVGAHPMAGSEQSGIEAARANLFEGAACIITPTNLTDPDALATVRAFWAAAGCILHEVTPSEHDRLLARISHLPHAAAAALVHTVIGLGEVVTHLAGNGYRDTTRIAAGPPDMWTEILLGNRADVISAIDDLTGSLDGLKSALQNADRPAVQRFLELSSQSRMAQRKPV